jgi:hypothetical protein
MRHVPRMGFVQGTLQSEGDRRRMAGERKASRGLAGGFRDVERSLMGALGGFVRPGHSRPGPEEGPPNPVSGIALRSQTEYGVYLSLSEKPPAGSRTGR